MNNNQALANRNTGLGNRAVSLGSVIKEKRNERNAAQDIKYELGNGQAADDDDVGEGDQSNQRVIMMYDEDGKATPMPMGGFYYDSVQLKDTEDEEEDPTDNGRQEQDTVRANVPAPFEVQGDFSDSGSSEGEESKAITAPTDIEGKYVADGDDHEYEDEEVEDRFKNQFMRIEIPAAQLKDVSRVKKDLDHDKPYKKKSLMVGLQRAVSSVKISDGRPRTSNASGPPQARQASASRPSAAKLGRLMSFSREKKQPVAEPSAEASGKPESERTGGGLQRSRESSTSKPATRPGLAAVGRMMSINKSKGLAKPSEGSSQKSESLLADDGSENTASSRPADRQSSNSLQGVKHTSVNPGKRAGLAQIGRMLSINRKKPAAEAPPARVAHDSGSGSASSEHTAVSERSVDRERRESKIERPSHGQMRIGLAKMGRMMSLSRSKKQLAAPEVPKKDIGEIRKDPEEAKKEINLSPLSSSTVSSKPVDSPASEQHDRQDRGRDVNKARTSTTSNPRKEATRMSLKSAGRLLSLSRKPAAPAAVPAVATQETSEDEDRGRTLLTKSEGSPTGKDRTRRAQSVPPKNPSDEKEAEAGGSGLKLDGRASKFFYTEIRSDRVRMSGLLGSETHIRVPAIAMAEYSGPVSRTKWYIDAFTLPHNAVRRECIDLYEILTAMARFEGDGDITRDDVNDFEDWWKTASGFLNCYFEMERTILFPWVDAAGTTDFEVQMALKKMRSMKDKLQEHLIKIDLVWNEKTFKTPGEMFALVYKAVDEFVPRLMNYFADQEVLLPAIVRGYYRLDDRLKLDKEVVNLFMGGPLTRKVKEEAHHNLILLIRWIGNPRQLRAWIGKNLNSTARALYGEWYSQYQQKHYHFVRILRNRSKAMLLS